MTSSRDAMPMEKETEIYTIRVDNETHNQTDPKAPYWSSKADLISQDSTMRDCKSRLNYALYVDLPLFLIVLVLVCLIEFGIIPSMKTGYICNDPKLQMKFTGDTVSFKLIILLTLIVPVVFMWLCELYLHRPGDYSNQTSRTSVTFYRTLHWYREYLYGVALQLAVVEGVKVMIGEPRPHFFDTCKPSVACVGSEYVMQYKCNNTAVGVWILTDSGRSFPSGHSSLSAHLALFIAWYVQVRLMCSNRRPGFFLPMVQVLSVIGALAICISRITDNRHHWWDVMAGGLIGVISVWYTVKVLCRSFSTYEEAPSCSSDSISDTSSARAARRLIPDRTHCTTPPHAAA